MIVESGIVVDIIELRFLVVVALSSSQNKRKVPINFMINCLILCIFCMFLQIWILIQQMFKSRCRYNINQIGFYLMRLNQKYVQNLEVSYHKRNHYYCVHKYLILK